MSDTANQGLTPQHEDWEADFDPTYEEKTQEGGIWFNKTDDEIVLLQIQEFNDDEHEENHRALDELAARKLED
ncbi:hypothetical protein GVN15_25760 [Pseudomonas putida]|uniref:hypothetical protein n=1 Tax=Pseudomonas putida TaxID=303 RepID=UPI001376DEE7|nr:hypothetical protein [Pseudomonas putida]NBA84048.1 hypothetical protein [Pseudomonas putida]